NIIYMNPYPAGVSNYLKAVGLSSGGNPSSSGVYSHAEAWVAPSIVSQPASTNVNSGSTVTFHVTATGLPLFYQWLSNGVALADGGSVSGALTANLTLTSVKTGATYTVSITNGAASISSAPAALTVNGAPVIVSQPSSVTKLPGALATFS